MVPLLYAKWADPTKSRPLLQIAQLWRPAIKFYRSSEIIELSSGAFERPKNLTKLGGVDQVGGALKLAADFPDTNAPKRGEVWYGIRVVGHRLISSST
jgi:hypothetical protein